MKYAEIDISPSRLGTVMDINSNSYPVANSINLIIEKKNNNNYYGDRNICNKRIKLYWWKLA